MASVTAVCSGLQPCALLDRDIQTPRNASCTALTDVVTLRVGKDDFWKVMREQPNLTIELMKVVIDRYVTR